MAETFYSVLGVDPEADTETIKDAYRELAKTHHPDVSDEEDAVAQFKRITEARDVLTDESSRRQYDRVGHATYIQRYMDGTAWTVDDEPATRQTNRSNARRTGDTDGPTMNTSGSTTGAAHQTGATRRSRQSYRRRQSDTAHNYDRYRSEYTAGETHSDESDGEDRAWTEDFDWEFEDVSAEAGSTETTGGESWHQATATAAGSTATTDDFSASVPTEGSMRSAVREIGPWLLFHLVFLASASLTVWLLLQQLQDPVVSMVLSLFLLGIAVFFSVLHLISQVF